MNTQEFTAAYSEPRNGANRFIRHPLARRFIYSDGVQQCAEVGCYWLLDIVATECVRLTIQADVMGILHVVVKKSKAVLKLSFSDEAPPTWTKKIAHTDMPDGNWMFYLNSYDGETVSMILPTEY